MGKRQKIYNQSQKLVSYSCGLSRIRHGWSPNDAWNYKPNQRIIGAQYRHTSLSRSSVYSRIARGWDLETALNTPKITRG